MENIETEGIKVPQNVCNLHKKFTNTMMASLTIEVLLGNSLEDIESLSANSTTLGKFATPHLT